MPETPTDLFIAEDSHQRVYGQRIVLSAYGIKIVGRSQRLTLDHRTTAQNLAWAVNVLRGAAVVDLEECTAQSSHCKLARIASAARLYLCANLTDELDQAASLVRGWIEGSPAPARVAVLVRCSSNAIGSWPGSGSAA